MASVVEDMKRDAFALFWAAHGERVKTWAQDSRAGRVPTSPHRPAIQLDAVWSEWRDGSCFFKVRYNRNMGRLCAKTFETLSREAMEAQWIEICELAVGEGVLVLGSRAVLEPMHWSFANLSANWRGEVEFIFAYRPPPLPSP